MIYQYKSREKRNILIGNMIAATKNVAHKVIAATTTNPVNKIGNRKRSKIQPISDPSKPSKNDKITPQIFTPNSPTVITGPSNQIRLARKAPIP